MIPAHEGHPVVPSSRHPVTPSPPDDAPPPPGLLGRLFRHVPALDELRRYTLQAFGGDLTAGLTVATVAVPQAMAYAILAGVPPQHGLYTAIVMCGVGALFASSRQLINGPTNAISIALLSALVVVPERERVAAAVLLTFQVGVIQLGIALLRLGDLTRYVSHSVIVGFTAGAGTLLVLDQVKNLLGLKAAGGGDDHFLKRFWMSLSGSSIHWPTFLIGVGTIALVVGIRKFNTFRRAGGARFPVPQHLVAVALMAALVWGLRLNEQYGVKIVGDIVADEFPRSPPRFLLPDVSWEQTRLFAGNAFAIAILGLLEAIAMSKAIAAQTGQKLDINQQCLSEGAANLAGSFFQCIPGSGSLTRSAVNQQAGAVTQWSGVFSAAAVAGIVLLFAPLAKFIPLSSLAGLLMLAAFRMVDRQQLAFHFRATRLDAGVILATAIAAVAISVEFCIVIGVFLSFVLYVPRAANVRMTQLVRTRDNGFRERQADEPACGRLLLYRLEGELFFGVEPELKKHFVAIEQAARGDVRAVMLVLERARNPDAAFLSLLRSLDRNLRRRDVALILCGVGPDLAEALARTRLADTIGAARICRDRRDAVEAAYKLLGDDVCSTCPRRQASDTAGPWWDYVI
jgi:SulP family sulfate permease